MQTIAPGRAVEVAREVGQVVLDRDDVGSDRAAARWRSSASSRALVSIARTRQPRRASATLW